MKSSGSEQEDGQLLRAMTVWMGKTHGWVGVGEETAVPATSVSL